MSLLRFAFPINSVPPDRYRHTAPDGHVIVRDDREEWFSAIVRHYRDNNIPLPENWRALAEDALCRVLPPGLCLYSDGSAPKFTVNTRLNQEMLLRGMRVLAAIAMAPDPLVEQAEAERRARICASCPANVGSHACSSCIGLAEKVAAIRGAKKTEADGKLQICAICGCSNKAQTWIKGDLLAKGVEPEMLEQFRLLSHCWKTAAIEPYL